MRHGVGIFKLRHVAVSTEKITPPLDPNGASKADHYDESILRGFGVFNNLRDVPQNVAKHCRWMISKRQMHDKPEYGTSGQDHGAHRPAICSTTSWMRS